MLTIWGRANSINVQKVMWTVGELDLPHERIPVGGSFGGLNDPEFRAMNPNGLVPVLRDGDALLWESNTIVRYLVAKYDTGGLWPEDPLARAQADRWLDWAASTASPAMTPVFFATVRAPRAAPKPPDFDRALEKLNRTAGILNEALGDGPYILGPSFSMGDIALGAFTARYLRMPVERPHLPNLEGYFSRLQEGHQAFRENVLLPFGTCQEEWQEFERKYG